MRNAAPTAAEWITRRPIAHRGLHNLEAGIAENTLAAAHAAIESNYAIEVDIRPSADAVAIVFHDATLQRQTGKDGRIEDYAAEDLCQFRINGSDETIATLDRLLDLLGGRTGLFLEIKSDDVSERRLCEAFLLGLAERLKSYDGPIAVMSFDPAAVRTMLRLAPNIPGGLVSRAYREPGDRDRFGGIGCWWRRNLISLLETRASFVAYDAQALPALAPGLARRAGLRLISWTVRDEAEMRRIAAHVDQIIFEGFRP